MSEKRQTKLTGQACGAGPGGQAQAGKKIVVLLATDSLGKPDEALGQHIVVNFIMKMKEMKDDLWRLILLNGAVKHTAAGSEGLPHLQELARNGLGILVCGPCLKTFNLLERQQVGQLTSMVDIVTSMQMADKVISLA